MFSTTLEELEKFSWTEVDSRFKGGTTELHEEEFSLAMFCRHPTRDKEAKKKSRCFDNWFMIDNNLSFHTR
jgi:hypothetical protein